jgi:hypothetical protein
MIPCLNYFGQNTYEIIVGYAWTMGKYKSIEVIIGYLSLLSLIFIVYAFSRVEYTRNYDPSGQYEYIISYRRFLSWIPMPPARSLG